MPVVNATSRKSKDSLRAFLTLAIWTGDPFGSSAKPTEGEFRPSRPPASYRRLIVYLPTAIGCNLSGLADGLRQPIPRQAARLLQGYEALWKVFGQLPGSIENRGIVDSRSCPVIGLGKR